ncbi:MAG TPA: M23 family metallopeptidase [Blastocatellia bacterium]
MRGRGRIISGLSRAAALVPLGLIIIAGAVLLLNLQTPRHPWDRSKYPFVEAPSHAFSKAAPNEPGSAGQPKTLEPSSPASGTASTNAPSSADAANPVTDSDLSYLASRNLLIPVAGVKATQLHDSFNDSRSGGRQHQAIDVMAPQGTPVLAASDGVVVRLFQSANGGTTLYEQDPSGLYVYYYAHLMRYADGIAEGQSVKRGQTIAYVGDTGNAGPGNFHLHFAISKVSSPRKWSGGTPIDPYPFLAPK